MGAFFGSFRGFSGYLCFLVCLVMLRSCERGEIIFKFCLGFGLENHQIFYEFLRFVVIHEGGFLTMDVCHLILTRRYIILEPWRE